MRLGFYMGYAPPGTNPTELVELAQEAERLGYAVLVAEGSALVMALIQSGKIDAIVGVSCLSVLERANHLFQLTHMTAEKFRLRAGIDVTAVNYKGGAVPVIALLGGEIAIVMATVDDPTSTFRIGPSSSRNGWSRASTAGSGAIEAHGSRCRRGGQRRWTETHDAPTAP